MKILRIVYDWPPPWDGLAPHPYELTKAQVEHMGHEVVLFCGRWLYAGPLVELPRVTVKTFGREPFPGTLNLLVSPLLLFYYIYWRRNNDVDVIHCHGHFAIWIYLYRLLLKNLLPDAYELRTPLVVHFHNTVEGRWRAAEEKGTNIKSYSRYISWPLARLSDKWAVEAAEALVFVSDGNKQEAIEYYEADPQKCFVVESGVNTELFCKIGAEEREKSRKELGFEQYDRVIVNHGVMVERKNIHILVRAMKYLPQDYKLLLVGSGDNDYLTSIDVLVTELQLGDRVVKVGYTPYPQVPIAFQIADLFVLPSSFEGLPKVVMQSLACETAALVSGFKLSEEIRGLYYLDNLNPEHIAQRIKEIVESDHPVDIAKIRGMYSWRERAVRLEQIYKFAASV